MSRSIRHPVVFYKQWVWYFNELSITLLKSNSMKQKERRKEKRSEIQPTVHLQLLQSQSNNWRLQKENILFKNPINFTSFSKEKRERNPSCKKLLLFDFSSLSESDQSYITRPAIIHADFCKINQNWTGIIDTRKRKTYMGVFEFAWSSWKISFLLNGLLLLLQLLLLRWAWAIAVSFSNGILLGGGAMEMILLLLLNFFSCVSWREAPIISCDIWHLGTVCLFLIFSFSNSNGASFCPPSKRRGLFFWWSHKIRNLLSLQEDKNQGTLLHLWERRESSIVGRRTALELGLLLWLYIIYVWIYFYSFH